MQTWMRIMTPFPLMRSMTQPDPAFALRHEIVILDAALTAPLPEDGTMLARAFVADLLRTLRMEPLAPLSVYPATDDRAPGWSFLQPITTSHLSGHYFLQPGPAPHIHLDIYSCDSVEWQAVVACVARHFPLGEWTGYFMVRGLSLTPRRVLELAGRGSVVHPARQAR